MVTLAVLWTTWCILHSLLISRTAHAAAKKIFPNHYFRYRLFYVCFSVVSLVPVLWYHFSLPQQVIIPGGPAVQLGQVILLVYAGFMFWAGAKVYDMRYFLGLTWGQETSSTDKEKGLPFHTGGVLAYVRHPWYSGGIAFLWGLGPITDIYLVTRIILTVYIILGTLLEEARLKREHGNRYLDYCKQVPMLIPWKIGKLSR